MVRVMGKPMRQAYGEALVELGKKYKDLVVFDADVASSTRTIMFSQTYPERFFNVGIAEMNMAAMAAGISTTGKIPFINTFACFMVLRCADPIRSLMAYTNLNVKIAGAYSGLSDSYDGASHHAIMDIGFMRSLPGMTVLSPCDGDEAAAATEAAILHQGPVYLRLHRNETPILTDYSREPFRIGKGKILREGKDLYILATGYMVYKALDAAESLEAEGISAGVVNMSTIKPLDEELVLQCARETGRIITAEEHSVHGGLGGAVAELLARKNPVPMAFVGVEDTFAESGDYEQLLEKYGLTPARIAEKARGLVRG